VVRHVEADLYLMVNGTFGHVDGDVFQCLLLVKVTLDDLCYDLYHAHLLIPLTVLAVPAGPFRCSPYLKQHNAHL
jgi:hypothetical protein